MIDVSIIIVNWNTRDLLEACLRSIYTDHLLKSFEVIVMDNGSDDGSVEMIRKTFPHVRLMVNSSNEGFAKPNNDGMRRAAGRYFFLLNSDTVLNHGAIATLQRFLDLNRSAGACAPRLVYPDGSQQRSVHRFPSLWMHIADMFFLDKIFPGSGWCASAEPPGFSYGETAEIDHAMAAAFMIRRRVFEEVGGFDERFRIYYNDMDWCYRIRKRGWRIHYVSDATVVHHHGQTVGRMNRDHQYVEEMYNNIMLYYHKHLGRLTVLIYRLVLAAGFVCRTIVWGIARIIRPGERTRHMFRFSLLSLRIGLQFWKPVPTSREIGK